MGKGVVSAGDGTTCGQNGARRSKRVVGPARTTHDGDLEKETDAESRYQLADRAATAASRMEPTDGAGIMMKIIKQKQYFYDEHRCTWTSSLFSLARRMPPAEATRSVARQSGTP